MSVAALIVAAGRGTRFGTSRPKQFLPLAGKPVICRSVEIFEKMPEFDEIWLVLPPDFAGQPDAAGLDLGRYRKIAGTLPGGERRQDSVRAGLERLSPQTEIVAIHDAVRPLASPAAISRALELARRSGGAVLAARVTDTIKRCDAEGRIVATVDRSGLWSAQTPQVFRLDLIREAYEKVYRDGAEITDDAAAVEYVGGRVEVVESPSPNPKITTPEDLAFAEWLLSRGG